ncbi:MAG: acetolactate synthase small subunit [Myxococcota bacterium]|nr:acetolactate synthase small subunit [Myxococcota bacterium]
MTEAAASEHTLTVRVRNEFGVLSRVVGLFSARGYNIDSLCVAESLDPAVSQITIVTRGNDEELEQITKQLYKLIDVIKVIEHDPGDCIGREMAFFKVRTQAESRAEVMRIAEIFRSKIVDVCSDSYTIELTGSPGKVEAFTEMLRPLGLEDVIRSGRVAVARGL